MREKVSDSIWQREDSDKPYSCAVWSESLDFACTIFSSWTLIFIPNLIGEDAHADLSSCYSCMRLGSFSQNAVHIKLSWLLLNYLFLRRVGEPQCSSTIFPKRNNFCDFAFAFVADQAFQNWDLLLKERICSWLSKFFPLRLDPHLEQRQYKKLQSCFPLKCIHLP